MKQLSDQVIGCAIRVHRELGPGLLESVYEECLSYELSKAEIYHERQKVLPIIYDKIHLDAGYRIDLLIDNKLIVELKAVELLLPIHLAQTLTYLRLADYRLGLLINFNVPLLIQGVKRVVNGY
ncbi:MAG TPA: GxxExxY protein [Fibrella sp.]